MKSLWVKWMLCRKGRNIPRGSFVEELIQEIEKGHVAGAPWADTQPVQRECRPVPSACTRLASFLWNTAPRSPDLLQGPLIVSRESAPFPSPLHIVTWKNFSPKEVLELLHSPKKIQSVNTG